MSVDVLILSNGPGEVTTWVRPVVQALRHKFGHDRQKLRISVILSPCPHATGKEVAIARHYPEVDRVQSSEHFFSLVLWGKTVENWDFRKNGVVIFLGGDQFFALLIGKRLGYRILVYGEWEARWYRWVDHFALRNEGVKAKVPQHYQNKCTVIGDLMADMPNLSSEPSLEPPIIGLMPGSKPAKLMQGVPFSVAIAQHIRQQHPHAQFILPVAPTVDPTAIVTYADPQQNPLVAKMGNTGAKFVIEKEKKFLVTHKDVKIELITDFPAYEALCRCCLVLTTVGANTAQLGTLGVPMMVLIPTQQLDAMQTWDGIAGIVMRMPVVGANMARVINHIIVKQGRLFAWPNIWANQEIVPELVGELSPEAVGDKVLDLITHPEQLKQIRDRLRQVRGETGAATRLSEIMAQWVTEMGASPEQSTS